MTGGTAAPVSRAADHLWGFLGALAAAGVHVPPDKQADLLRAISGCPPDRVGRLYWYARVALVQAHDQLAPFDAVFEAWFGHGAGAGLPPPPTGPDEEEPAPSPPHGDGQEPDAGVQRGEGIRASARAVVGRREFAPPTAAQRELTRELTGRWPRAVTPTVSPRRRPARRGDRLDARRVVREARRRGGEVVTLHWRARPTRPRKVLVVVDVSGSLRQHTPDYLLLAHAAVRGVPGRAEVFTVGTRLTRVTRELAVRDPGRALRAVSGTVLDADGGTALGASLQAFLADSRHVSLVRGALVVVLSDGLERGDPGDLVAATDRLARLAYRVVWWSPLACSPTYRPVTRAMAAQLPHLDRLAGVGDLASASAELAGLAGRLRGARRTAARRWADRTDR